MLNGRGGLLLVIGALLLLPPSTAAGQEMPEAVVGDGPIPFEMAHLDNGLRVILAPDPEATAVAVNLWYDVGSRHERPGRSGFAHLFEHLMFEGSEYVESGEHMRLVERAGGQSNASITHDRTNYFQTVPPERMNLALWLEAERLRNLDVTEENLRREVDVVKEERLMRVDNSPYGETLLEAQYYTAYDSTACFPYAHSVVGSPEDLDAAELEDVHAFFETHYVPANATLTVAGGFDAETAWELVHEYFGPIPAGEEPDEVSCEDPFVHLPVSRELEDPNANLPAFTAAYGAVPAHHEDAYALHLLGGILGTGESSRLHQRLVREEQAALDVTVAPDLRRGPGVFIVFAVANQGVEAESLQEMVDQEVARVTEEGVTDAELERALNRRRANEVLGRQDAMGRAESLQWYNHFHGTPEALQGDLERYEAVTAEDLQAIAARYLNPENRAAIITRPASAGAGEGGDEG